VSRRFAVCLFLVACRGERAPDVSPVGPVVEIALDGKVRSVMIAGPRLLAELVDAPPEAWLEVRADDGAGRWLEVPTPTTTYPRSELRLYLVERNEAAGRSAPRGVDDARVGLGVFPPVEADLPPDIAARARQPLATLMPLARIDVWTRPPALPPLHVELDGRVVAVPGDQLRALERTRGGAGQASGWPLVEVLRLAGRADPQTVHVIGAGTTELLDAAALRDPSRQLLLKVNQRGEYVMRVWDAGGRSPLREVRAVTRIVVE
jgi:hypothetical protein